MSTTTRPLGAGFTRLWTASGTSNIADGIDVVVLPLLAATLTRSPALVAGVALAERLPWLVFALPAGALADRLDRRRVMIGVQLLRFAVLGTLAALVAADVATIWLIYAAAIILGIGETMYDTAAQSAITAVVDKDDLSRANSRLYAAELTANQFIGPPLGGVLAGIAGVGLALGLGTAAVLFAVAALLLSAMRGVFQATAPEGAPARGILRGLRADIAEGLRYLTGNRVLRTFAVMTGLQNLAFTATFSVFVLYAVGPGSPMGLTRSQYGLLFTALGVGAVLGSLLTDRAQRLLGRFNVLVVVLATGVLMTIVPAFTTSPWPIAAAMVIGSVGTVMWNVVTVSLRQRIAPDHLLGRVNAGYRLLAWGSMPLGAALGGAVGELLGLRAVFLIAGALVLLNFLLLPAVTEARLRDVEAV
jgi:MFS family permease